VTIKQHFQLLIPDNLCSAEIGKCQLMSYKLLCVEVLTISICLIQKVVLQSNYMTFLFTYCEYC